MVQGEYVFLSTMTEAHSQANLALRLIRDTGISLFLTGKAGTGKTTFLKQLKASLPKRMIVVAPTGVAAINAGGVTIHSFFQLPFGPYLPGQYTAQKPSYTNKFGREKINIIRSMDLLVIDEISMVRADLLDAVSDVLQRYRDRDRPFGGVQLLLIGDLQQLAPVVKDDEWLLLKDQYVSPFFFESKALQETPYQCIELTHVYRQQDDAFVSLLNNIRENRFDDETLRALNQRYLPGFRPKDDEGFITLTTHNALAQQLNRRKLDELPGRAYTFGADVKDDFPSYAYPADERLELKTGAQVMFIKNDTSGEKQYYNGKIGKVVFVDMQTIKVVDALRHEIVVSKETWQNTKYSIDPETQEITETITGTFSQYPLKTAWAITIHKSQGLTFERAIVDAESAFSHGQVYVALSRCKSLEGLVLSSPVTRNAMIIDGRIRQYTDALDDRQVTEDFLAQAQHQYFLRLVMELFDFRLVQQRLQYASYVVFSHLQRLFPSFCDRYAAARDAFHQSVTDVGARFQQQLHRLITENSHYQHDPVIQERICKGSVYFLEQITAICGSLMTHTDVEIDNKEVRKLVSNAIRLFADELTTKQETLKACREGFSVAAYLSAKARTLIEAEPAKKKKKEKSPAQRQSKETASAPVDMNTTDIQDAILYNRLRQWRNEQAARKGLPVYTILQQKALIGLANHKPVSKGQMLHIPGIGKKVLDAYGDELLAIILEHPDE